MDITGHVLSKRTCLAAVIAVFLVTIAGCGGNTAEVVNNSSDGIIWKDAAGVTVPVFGEPGGTLLYLDAAGRFWTIDWETLRVGPAEVDDGPMFASSDCTGAAWVVAPPPPRVTFMLGFNINQPGGPTIYIRNDVLTEGPVTICSARQPDGTCSALASCAKYIGVLGAEMTPSPPLTVPTVAFLAPLHPEVAQ